MKTKKSPSQKAPEVPKPKKLPKYGFFYTIEHCINPDCLQIHTKSKVPADPEVGGLGLDWVIKNNGKPGCEKRHIHSLYFGLVRVRGLKAAYDINGGYGLQLVKANHLFTWDEILPKVLDQLKIHVAKKRKLIEAAPARHPTDLERERAARASLRIW